MDVFANIALVVESEKRVISGHSSRVPNTKIVSLSREILGTVDCTAPVYLYSSLVSLILILTAAFF